MDVPYRPDSRTCQRHSSDRLPRRPIQVTDEQIDDRIDEWHESTTDDGPLHEWLGMTWVEFGQWLEGGSVCVTG